MKKVLKVIIAIVLVLVVVIGGYIAYSFYLDNAHHCIDEEPNSTPTGKFGAYGYVDLGLSVKWAVCNIGANVPGEHGQAFAWGDTETKETFGKHGYSIGDRKNLAELRGTQYDTANAKWGDDWRMPTALEFEELCKKCKWMWSKQNGEFGFKIVGPNGNSIFLPCSHVDMTAKEKDSYDEACYWSSTKDDGISEFRDEEDVEACAAALAATFVYYRSNPYQDEHFTRYVCSDFPCHVGLPIRPVHD